MELHSLNFKNQIFETLFPVKKIPLNTTKAKNGVLV